MSETTVNVGKATSGGYRPLSLTLKGFKGIRSGLGRDAITLDLEALVGDDQLVAIAGSNGRGKTTIMDNLHPFLVMPSRAGADGLGAFSYYDHVCLPESEKDLTWAHAGRSYRSQVVVRWHWYRWPARTRSLGLPHPQQLALPSAVVLPQTSPTQCQMLPPLPEIRPEQRPAAVRLANVAPAADLVPVPLADAAVAHHLASRAQQAPARPSVFRADWYTRSTRRPPPPVLQSYPSTTPRPHA